MATETKHLMIISACTTKIAHRIKYSSYNIVNFTNNLSPQMCNFQIGFVASCPTCKGSASLAAWLSSSQTGPQSHCNKAMSWSLLTMSPCLKCKNVHNERCSNQFYCRWRERAFWVMVWLRWTDSRACSSALPDEDTNTAGHTVSFQQPFNWGSPCILPIWK